MMNQKPWFSLFGEAGECLPPPYPPPHHRLPGPAGMDLNTDDVVNEAAIIWVVGIVSSFTLIVRLMWLEIVLTYLQIALLSLQLQFKASYLYNCQHVIMMTIIINTSTAIVYSSSFLTFIFHTIETVITVTKSEWIEHYRSTFEFHCTFSRWIQSKEVFISIIMKLIQISVQGWR